jgi:hypothetical protein
MFPIIFVVRTHSQSKQVVEEVKKLSGYRVKLAILSARDHSCSRVGKNKVKNPVDEKLLLKEKGDDLSLKCHELRREGKCGFYKNL